MSQVYHFGISPQRYRDNDDNSLCGFFYKSPKRKVGNVFEKTDGIEILGMFFHYINNNLCDFYFVAKIDKPLSNKVRLSLNFNSKNSPLRASMDVTLSKNGYIAYKHRVNCKLPSALSTLCLSFYVGVDKFEHWCRKFTLEVDYDVLNERRLAS